MDEIIEDGDVDPEFGQDPILTPDQRKQLKQQFKALLNQIPVDPNFGVEPEETASESGDGFDHLPGEPTLPDDIKQDLEDDLHQIISGGNPSDNNLPGYINQPILIQDQIETIQDEINDLFDQIPVKPNIDDSELPQETTDKLEQEISNILNDKPVDPEFGNDPVSSKEHIDAIQGDQ